MNAEFDRFFVIAGAISSAIATPTDVLKVRMQVHGRGTDKVGLIGCFREIYQHEGISGLWRVSVNSECVNFAMPTSEEKKECNQFKLFSFLPHYIHRKYLQIC